ncbi:MAG TPA: hypothetical protein VD902_14265, partial [Symbiobacteriaceae bacterium]|nr:hypothetical protein [Symbiobacteriaceae bacterium]
MSVTRRVTIMVIPETGKRTLSLSFAPVWLLTLPLLFVCVAVYAYLQFSQNQMLVQQVHELDQLRRTNRLQEAQIESIQGKVMSTEKKLEVLQQLEQQIREITEQGMSSSRSGAPALPAAAGEGRGGPMPTAAPQSSLPTLNALLPPEARAHLLGKRDTLPLHMIEPSTHQSNPERTAQQAIEAEVLVNDQEAELTRLADSLDTGKRAIEAQMDYIAHRPTGLPVSGAQLTDRFGSRWSPFGWGEQLHEGVDL